MLQAVPKLSTAIFQADNNNHMVQADFTDFLRLERYKLPGKVELIEERPQEPKLEGSKRPARWRMRHQEIWQNHVIMCQCVNVGMLFLFGLNFPSCGLVMNRHESSNCIHEWQILGKWMSSTFCDRSTVKSSHRLYAICAPSKHCFLPVETHAEVDVWQVQRNAQKYNGYRWWGQLCSHVAW